MSNAEDFLRDFLPTSFGKKQTQNNLAEKFAKTKRQEAASPAIDKQPETEQAALPEPETKKAEVTAAPAQAQKRKAAESDTDDEDDLSDDDEPEADILPISHEIKLMDHTRAVTALALDPSGSRLITGGYDYELKFWDFAGMNQTFRPFRSIEPCEGNQIHDLHYSLTGDSFLVISGTARAKLFDREGSELCEYVKGDPYIRDLRHTDGHVAALTSGAWHPKDRQYFATSSKDGTIRIWDVDRKRKQKSVIVHKSRERGGRSAATTMTYSLDGKMITGAFMDGTIQIWGADGPYIRPSISIDNAHQKLTETSSLVFARDGHTLVSRGGDDTVKVWDIRNSKKPVNVAENLESINPETNVIFSPDERLIMTGTSVPKGQGYGKLVMLDRQTLEIRRTMSITQSSVVRVLWHPRINQIVTGSADGSVHVFYSPDHSVRGAKLCVVKEPKKRAVDDYEIDRPIITPHALPLFKDDQPRSSKRKREKLREDPKASHRPELPVKGPGKGGKVGINEQQAVIASFGKDTTRDEDPREALLKYAEIAEKEPMWVSNLYKRTQPKPIFQEGEEEEEDDKKKRK